MEEERHQKTNKDETPSQVALWSELVVGLVLVVGCAYAITSHNITLHAWDDTIFDSLPESWRFAVGTASSLLGIGAGMFFIRRATRLLLQKKHTRK